MAHYLLRFRANLLLCMTCKNPLFSGRQLLPGPGISCLVNRQDFPLAWNLLCIFPRKLLEKPGRKFGTGIALPLIATWHQIKSNEKNS